jgi:hypothetical protein
LFCPLATNRTWSCERRGGLNRACREWSSQFGSQEHIAFAAARKHADEPTGWQISLNHTDIAIKDSVVLPP